jgi:hypothetical protein
MSETQERARLLSKVSAFLTEEVALLLSSCCVRDKEDGTPDRSTLEPDDAMRIEEVEKLLIEVDAALEKEINLGLKAWTRGLWRATR